LFSVNIDFNEVRFSEETNFAEAEFSKDTIVSFFKSEFTGETYFSGAKFLGKISFYSTNISDSMFNDAEFLDSSNADFRKAIFGDTYFQRVKFLGKIDFSDAKFLRYTNFSKAIFFEFPEKANFENVEFSEDLYFEEVKFLREISFKKNKFKNSYFNKVEFKDVFFDDAIFFGETQFKEVKFWGGASFRQTDFMSKTSFHQSEFSGPLRFSFATFTGKIDLIPNKSNEIYLDNVFFGEYVKIKANLSLCYFQGSNIEIIDLTNSEWDLADNNSIIIWEDYKKVLDWRELEGIYRRLKQSYQRHGDYSTSGKFYYREMDLHGEQLKFLYKLLWNIGYKYTCGYGEKPFNVLFVSIFMIFMFSIIYFYSGILVLGKDIINYNLSLNSFNLSWIGNYVWCLYMSIAAFTTMGFGDVQPIGLSRPFAYIEAGIGIFMTALFIFVFTRKMLR